MVSQDELLNKVMDSVSETLVSNLREVVASTVEREITASLTSALVESEFHRRLSHEMRDGLQKIYKEIARASASSNGSPQPEAPHCQETADRLFSEASQQLDAVLTTTEEATGDIMDVVEKHLDLQAETTSIIDAMRRGNTSPEALERLAAINEALGSDLVSIMTTLSFQDITGQRIKKIVEALQKIEATVVELYLSSGLLMKAREEAPEKDIDELERETRKTVSELKGPQREVSQANIDDMLAQLGL